MPTPDEEIRAIASHLSNLISIIQDKEDGGGRVRSKTLTWEYERSYARMRELIKGEQEHEARSRKDNPRPKGPDRREQDIPEGSSRDGDTGTKAPAGDEPEGPAT